LVMVSFHVGIPKKKKKLKKKTFSRSNSKNLHGVNIGSDSFQKFLNMNVTKAYKTVLALIFFLTPTMYGLAFLLTHITCCIFILHLNHYVQW